MSSPQPSVFSVSALADSPLHQDLAAIVQAQGFRDWPTDAQLNRLLPTGANTSAGCALHFATRDDAGLDGAAAYETHINQTGEIPLRPRHWHDLFNALMWARFPATKTALNAAHCAELTTQGTRRSRRRDALTLLDECGVVLAVADNELTEWHTAHRWHDLFVTRRDVWGVKIAPLVIGHGLYEQCLAPYLGLTAKALHVPVADTWFTLDTTERVHHIDRQLAASVARDEVLLSTRELRPLPILGIPGWWPANADPAFYANTAYFRQKR